MVTEKKCRGCSRVLPLTDYPPQERGLYGMHSECRNCARIKNNARMRKKRRENPQPVDVRSEIIEALKGEGKGLLDVPYEQDPVAQAVVKAGGANTSEQSRVYGVAYEAIQRASEAAMRKFRRRLATLERADAEAREKVRANRDTDSD